MLVMNVCQDYAVLTVIYIFKILLNIIRYVVPVILIVMLMIDWTKSLVSLKEDMFNVSDAVKKVVAAVLVYLIPTLINGVLIVVGAENFFISECWINANMEMISTLKENYEELREQIENNESAFDEYLNDLAQNDIQTRIDADDNSNNSSSEIDVTVGGTSYDASTDTFTIPNKRATSDDDIPKQSGIKGLNPYFSAKLKKLIDDASAKGYNVTINSGYRSYSAQLKNWNEDEHDCSVRSKWVACPGGSYHGFGVAADLRFDNEKCSQTNFNCNDDAKWVHENAQNYGLHFRLNNEPWHIEPENIKGGNFGACTAKC